MKKIEVQAERSYDIIIGNKIEKIIKEKILNFVNNNKIMLITDKNLERTQLKKLLEIIDYKETYLTVINPGEESKNFLTYQQILKNLAINNFNRNDIIISFGGGVVGDISAFVASTYMRGIKFIQIPTSLLSMIDSSIGGKTAIDLNKYKNIVGTFYSPFLVLIDTQFLETLDFDEFKSGLGEFIKYAILDSKIYDFAIKKDARKHLEELIYLSLEYKADIVKKDFYEKNLRMFLNLGHTIAHALETHSNFKIKHGIAVVLGISEIIKYSKKFNIIEEGQDRLIDNLIKKYDLSDFDYSFSIDDLISLIKHDKKAKDTNSINMVLIKKIGECIIKLVNIKEL